MIAGHRWLGAIALFAATSGCGEDATSGAGEPFRVYRSDGKTPAQFFVGMLPFVAPTAGTEGESASSSEVNATTPQVVGFDATNRVVFPGQKQGTVGGLLSATASAVALQLEGGSGYWVVPAGVPDVTSDGKLQWGVKCDFSPDLPAGYRMLNAAAIAADGSFGETKAQKLCISGRIADYINACEPKSPPPAAVISLSWDTNVDLDLKVITSEGRLVSPKQPSTIAPDKSGAIPPEAGQIDRDSNAACSIDGIRFENLVFNQVRPSGTWGIYADLFDACKLPVVHFAANVYVSVTGEDGYSHLEQVASRQGVLLSTQASGDENAIGTYLFEVNFD